jgi:hypothetical protein
MAQPYIRPENRQRSSDGDTVWADTVPSSLRSEAFAEDLAASDPRELQLPPPRSAAMPLLSIALGAVFGLLAR